MPNDATPAVPTQADAIVGVDIDWIHICPKDQMVTYTLADVYQSGRVVVRPAKSVALADFAACIGSFCQATPRKKFLTYLVNTGYETGLTVTP